MSAPTFAVEDVENRFQNEAMVAPRCSKIKSTAADEEMNSSRKREDMLAAD